MDPAASGVQCVLDRGDKDMSIRVADDGLECNSVVDRRWCGVRATCVVLKGKYMFEVELVKGLLRVGWSAGAAKLELGMGEQSFGYGSTGKKSWNGKFEDFG